MTLSDLLNMNETCTNDKTQSIDIPTFITWLASDKLFQFIDVRTLLERQQINFGGLHHPLDQLKTSPPQVIANIPVVFYCASGMRSATACRYMTDIGFTNPCLNLVGGIEGLMKQAISPSQIAPLFNQEGIFIKQDCPI